MIVIACPGQGSQTPGFLRPWLRDSADLEWLGTVSERVGIDLVTHGTDSDADTIRRTEIAQPLIVAAGILAWNHLRERLVERHEATDIAFAGHSVGEVTAAYAAGVFDADTAVRFVAARAAAMQRCAEATPTGMAAVLGGDPDAVIAHLAELGLAPANFNGGGQIVAAGREPDLTRLRDTPPDKARVVPLKVAGAFHTEFMRPARDELSAARDRFVAHAPHASVYSNRDGAAVTDGDEFLGTLIEQIARPVRWDLCMQRFAADGVTGMVELTPSGALAGLAKRGLRGTPVVKLDTPDDIDRAVEFILEASQA